jgi:hypothetical protein
MRHGRGTEDRIAAADAMDWLNEREAERARLIKALGGTLLMYNNLIDGILALSKASGQHMVYFGETLSEIGSRGDQALGIIRDALELE